ncbi:putative cytochrome b561 [Methylophaga lonarensis MPL]|uniref:Putative cytochrome b561 n=1 Tax=Methylophaga lonarensis MPL TaxID=1286106 RepID=M7PIU9_9GAMM|nr:cytochrome b [Methylophaga lonarensis]EMR13795.1 putative cytochrome b561 [Methylophaga lonarensis MPL]
MTTNSARYDRVQVALHWLIAAIVLFMIGLGLYMVELPRQDELPEGQESVRAFYFLLHKSLGITAAILIFIRVGWRLTHTPPPLPDFVPSWQQRVSSFTHGLLYALMIAMPISGYAQSMFSSFDTYLWGITLPRLAEADAAMRENFTVIHQWLAYLFIAVLVLHIAAAIKHRIDNDGIFDRMSFKRD